MRASPGSTLIGAGESPERVRRLLGHKDIGTTIHTYGDHFDFPPNGALARLDALLATPRRMTRLRGGGR